MTKRTAVSIAVVGASLLWGALASPVASADDPLGPIRGAVNGDRTRTACPAFAYSQVLEDLAQAAVRPGDRTGGDLSAYNGTAKLTIGWGDPQAAAINDAYQKGAGQLIGNCSYTEFGVGFHRDESLEYDSVSIVFGTPAKAAPPPAPNPDPVPTPAVQQCPAGSPTPTVPASGTCAPVPPPKDAVRVSFVKGFQWTVNVTSTADIAGKCTYVATNPLLPGANRSFDIAPKGSASFTVLAPPPLSTYHVVVSCTGPFNGATVEFGRVEQDVSAQ